MPGATPIFSGEGFEAALVSVPTGTFSKHTLKAMRARDTRAKELGVPVLVKLGTTKFFAVRDGAYFQRNVVGGWAHVKCDESGGKTTYQCKVGESYRVVLRWCDTDAVQVLGISVERSIRVSSGYRRA